MLENPEKRFGLFEGLDKRTKKTLLTIGALAVLYWASIDDIEKIDTESMRVGQQELVIEIPEGMDREEQSLLIAQRLVATMEVSDEDMPIEGGHGALGQVVFDVDEEFMAEKFGRNIELSEETHHLAIMSYYFLEDNGSQTANIIIGDKWAIRLSDRVLDVANFLYPFDDLSDSHKYDIESTAFVLREDGEGELRIANVLVKQHAKWVEYDPKHLRVDGPEQRITFVMARGKRTIYPSQKLCNSKVVDLFGGALVVSADVCDAEEKIEFKISEGSMVGEPGNTLNPIEDNPDFVHFPEGSDARMHMGRARSVFNQ